jgi:hypothetical protein
MTLLGCGEWVVAGLAEDLTIDLDADRSGVAVLLQQGEILDVEIPVFFRRDEGQVRLHKTDCEEKGLFLPTLPITLNARVGLVVAAADNQPLRGARQLSMEPQGALMHDPIVSLTCHPAEPSGLGSR